MKTTLFSLILLAGLLSACQDISLDQVPVTSRSEANFYQTNADFYNAVVGVYGTFKKCGYHCAGQWFVSGDGRNGHRQY